MCPSAFRVSSPQAQGGGDGVKPAPKCGDVRRKFPQDWCRGWDFH